MREVFRATRALPFEEWEDYWVSEKINDRGVLVDEPLCHAAKRIVEATQVRLDREMAEVTDKEVTACSNRNRSTASPVARPLRLATKGAERWPCHGN